MKLGIKKIEHIPARSAGSWKHVEKNGSVDISPYLHASLQELRFADLTCDLEEDWQESSSGKFSAVTLTGIIRSDHKTVMPTLAKLKASKNIFRVTAICGEKMMIGSVEFAPVFLYKKVITGIDSYEIQFSITCQSPQGLIYDTSL